MSVSKIGSIFCLYELPHCGAPKKAFGGTDMPQKTVEPGDMQKVGHFEIRCNVFALRSVKHRPVLDIERLCECEDCRAGVQKDILGEE